MKIRMKIRAGFAAVIVIMLAMGGIAFYNLESVSDDLNVVVKEKFKKSMWANNIIDAVNESAITMRDLVLTDDASIKQQIEQRQKELTVIVGKNIDSLKSNLKDDKEKQIFEGYLKARELYIAARKIIIENMNAGNIMGAVNTLTADFKVAQTAYLNAMGEFVTYENAEANRMGDEASVSVNTAIWITGILLILGGVIGVVVSSAVGKSIVNPIDESITAAESISAGNMKIKLDVNRKDETGLLMQAMKKMSESIEEMVSDANRLAEAAINGKLDVRADANKYQGEFKNLILGFNNTLDAVINPLNVTAEYVDRISKGDIPQRINDDYKGDFNEIKNNVNQLIDTFNGLKADVDHIMEGVAAGSVANTRADVNKHLGIYRQIIQGFNTTLDLVSAPLTEIFEVLGQLSEGNLSARMTKAYKGNFEVLKQNLNNTIDSLPLEETMKVMQAMADGDLTAKINGEYKGDSLKLKNAVNDSLESLNEILHNVRTTVEEVTRGAMQVSDASTNLSQGATEQAASLEEITSSMSEIGSQTRLNAENANQANALSTEARDAAEKGNEEMSQLSDAMNEINESSKNISKIIKVIDEIAFQTNLLALNAAVEAARAGRHGKGFAVVAEEVRNLAARSATAAKETAEMIENSIKTVERGTGLVAKTGEALEEIKNGSVKVADIVGEITTSSNEQAQGISQINEGLSQIDKVTQTNTASAEQSASASEQLSGQAGQLRDLIERFKLNNSASYGSSMNAKMIGSSSRRSNSRKALPSKSYSNDYADDLEDMLEFGGNDNYTSTQHPTIKPMHKASDIIKLDEDDFDRY